MSDITAILVTYNSEAVIASTLAALIGIPHITRVIVVDNQSFDNTCALIGREFPRVELIHSGGNMGFGRGNNLALEKVTTPFALLVNPDAVLQDDAVSILRESANLYDDAAILAPQLNNADGKHHFSFKRNLFKRELDGGLKVRAEGAVCAEYLSGAVMLLRMEYVRKSGFFDPNIFLYYEDDDICIQACKAGYSCVYVPDAKVMHLQGASSGDNNAKSEQFKQMHMSWARLYMQYKYHGLSSARKLARKHQRHFALKAALYCLVANRYKIGRYKGRLEGAAAFIKNPTQAPQ